MDVSRKTQRNQTVISLSGECTIYQAAELKPRLLEDGKGLDRNVLLDLVNVSELDCAGVQLLLMLKREVAAAGGNLEIKASNDTVDQVFSALNLLPLFQSPEAAL